MDSTSSAGEPKLPKYELLYAEMGLGGCEGTARKLLICCKLMHLFIMVLSVCVGYSYFINIYLSYFR